MRIALTGATGLLGRNVLFEFIRHYRRHLDDLEIIVLGRESGEEPLSQRIWEIMLTDGRHFVFPELSPSANPGSPVESNAQDAELQEFWSFCQNRIHCLALDLDEEKLNLRPEALALLAHKPIDYFFHMAAITDFGSSGATQTRVERTNVRGTERVLELVAQLEVKEFAYVGSAYSCGLTSGVVAPDEVDLGRQFRNHYERAKLEAELSVRAYSRRSGLRCRYFRPATICGRLIEPPVGSIPKFNVFYGWAAFFLREKLKRLRAGMDRYAAKCALACRIRYNHRSGLNIVPADYAAKVMVQVSLQNDAGESYHLVNEVNTPHFAYITWMLEALGITGVEHTDIDPTETNDLEGLYYKTVGKIFGPYIIPEDIVFDTTNLRGVLRQAGLNCPPVNCRTFAQLMEYAKKHNFGLRQG
jgi:nucleoside-diphosphate-sugar epimerase